MSPRPSRTPVGPGQESVWDYPRPPRLEPVAARLVVVLGGAIVAETTRGYRVLETSHPPNYYFPRADLAPGTLVDTEHESFCEWKGRAHYLTVRSGDRVEVGAAWAYDAPNPAFVDIAGYVAFYANRMDECTVDGEIVAPQPGGFYGGWITADVVGPFKGGPGTRGW